MVGVGLLALIGEVTIGLSKALVAGTRFPVKEKGGHAARLEIGRHDEIRISHVPGYRAPDSTAKQLSS